MATMHDLVIFGTGQIGELAEFYFTHDSHQKVVAFTVDGSHLKETQFLGRPVIPFESVAKTFPPDQARMFVALSYAKINALRAEKVASSKSMGYQLASYLSTRATTFAGFELGENCFILEDNTIQPFARVGANVTLWSGNHIGHHSIIEDDVFIASHVVVSGGVKIGRGSFVGVNVTIRDHVTIGQKCVLGAGALVLEDSRILPSLRRAEPSARRCPARACATCEPAGMLWKHASARPTRPIRLGIARP